MRERGEALHAAEAALAGLVLVARHARVPAPDRACVLAVRAEPGVVERAARGGEHRQRGAVAERDRRVDVERLEAGAPVKTGHAERPRPETEVGTEATLGRRQDVGVLPAAQRAEEREALEVVGGTELDAGGV